MGCVIGYRGCVTGMYMNGYRGVDVSRVCGWGHCVYRMCIRRNGSCMVAVIGYDYFLEGLVWYTWYEGVG